MFLVHPICVLPFQGKRRITQFFIFLQGGLRVIHLLAGILESIHEKNRLNVSVLFKEVSYNTYLPRHTLQISITINSYFSALLQNKHRKKEFGRRGQIASMQTVSLL